MSVCRSAAGFCHLVADGPFPRLLSARLTYMHLPVLESVCSWFCGNFHNWRLISVAELGSVCVCVCLSVAGLDGWYVRILYGFWCWWVIRTCVCVCPRRLRRLIFVIFVVGDLCSWFSSAMLLVQSTCWFSQQTFVADFCSWWCQRLIFVAYLCQRHSQTHGIYNSLYPTKWVARKRNAICYSR